jgi:PAS domain S-box-containing protein
VNIRPLFDHHGNIEGAINCFQDITAQKRLEAELRRQQTELEDFFENSAIPLHIVNAEGIIVRANQAEVDLLGYSRDEYIGRHVAEFHVDAPVIGEILQRLSCGKALDKFPARLRAKDGSIKCVLVTSNSRFDDGSFVSTRCFTVDVTATHEAEVARRDTEQRLAATYDAASVGIAEVDQTGKFLRVNEALCRIVGRTSEELLAMTFHDYTHPEDRAEDERRYREQVAGRLGQYTLRKRALRPDGSVIYLNVSGSAVRDETGRYRYGVRCIQDVTSAKQMEDQLREGERHWRKLLDAIPAAVYTTDAKGIITYFNPAAVEMSGRIPQPGDSWCVTWRLYSQDGSPLPHDECPMAKAIKEDRAIRGEEAIAERPDGSRVPFIPFPTPLHDAGGNLSGAINMLVDITERKRAENRQKTLIDELNHRVKNTLATVQSLAVQTARHAPSTQQFIEDFQNRLLALARAHDLLSKRYWQNAPLAQLLEDILGPLAADEQRLHLKGPNIDISPRMALSVTMTINELATNAVKYGALSTQKGKLHVDWSLAAEGDGKFLELTWNEACGPPVTPPTRRGFGSRLMERCIERDLGGNFDLAFEPEGLRCKMQIPLDPGRVEPLSSLH